MNSPRKHHFLPQFYLRGFSNNKRGLHQIWKATLANFGCNIGDTAAIKDFHILDYDGVEDPFALEKALAQVEGVFNTHLNEVISTGLRNKASIQYVIQMLGMLRLRVPAVKRHLELSLQSQVRAELNSLKRSGRLPAPPKGYENILDDDQIKIQIMNWRCLELMFKMAADDGILQYLYGMRVTLYFAPFGDAFVTSDQPVAYYHPYPEKLNGEGVGMLHKDVEISLPLSSRVLLKLDNKKSKHQERLATSKEVAEFNRRTIIMAKDYVFTGEHPNSILIKISENQHLFAGFLFDDLNTKNGGFMQVQRFVPVYPQ